MQVKDIQKILKEYQDRKQLVWEEKSFPGLSLARMVKSDVFGGESVSFTELDLREDLTGFTGSISHVFVMGEKSPACTMTVMFRENETGLVCELQAEFAEKWIPFCESRTGLAVSDMEYRWVVEEKTSAYTICQGRAELQYGNLTLSGTYTVCGLQKTVMFCCGEQTGSYPLEDILFGEEGEQYLLVLPDELKKILEGLTIKSWALRWNIETDSMELYSVEIGVLGEKVWQVIDGLCLGGFYFSVEVQQWGEEKKQVTWGIHGTMDIGKGKLPMSVYFQSEKNGFFVQTGDTETKVTGLDFLTPFCGEIPVKELPVSAPLEKIFFKSLYFEWDGDQNKIGFFEIQAGLDVSLEVGAVFSIREMDFTYSGSDEESSLILGGQFCLAGLPFAIEAEPSDGWLISAYTLGPDEISLSALAGEILDKCGVHNVPIPSIGLNTVRCSCDPVNQIVSFSAFAHVEEEENNGISFQSIAASVDLKLQKEEEKWQYEVMLEGEARFLDSIFDVTYQLNAAEEQNEFHLKWRSEPDFSLEKLLAGLGFGDLEIPEGLLPLPEQMQMNYDLGKSSLLIEVVSGEKKLLFGSEGGKEKGRANYLALKLGVQISLSEIPMAGSQVPELEDNGIKDVVFLFNTEDMNQFSAGDIVQGISAEAGGYFVVTMGTENFVFQIMKGNKKKNVPSCERKLESEKPGSACELQKKFGPFLLQRLLLTCKEGKIWIGLDASLETGMLRMELDGAMLGIPFSKGEPAFSLNGFGLSLTSPVIRFGGHFRKMDENTYQGSIEAGVSEIMVELVGEYNQKPYPSAFVLGELTGREVGPPCFSVNMIQAAFGYNRKFAVPSIEKLDDFVLIQMAKGNMGQQELIQKADTYFPVQKDTDFVAAGIRAKSFEMLEIFAVLAVMFGAETEFDLLGRAALEIPPNDEKPIVSAALLIKMSIRPGSGLIPVDGKISEDSYVIDKNCHLKGEFAFYLWYSGEHKGDCVISLGGYSDRFQRPEHYPAPERLGFEWKLTEQLSASGSMYFALTPSAIMAGGRFEMVFHEGCVEAWVRAAVEIWIGWKPYSYDFLIDVSIGVKAHLGLFHVKAELGCMLHIWGPRFSGIARIELWIISFSIPLRSGQKEQENVETISVDDFRKSFLPELQKSADDEGSYGGCTFDIQASGTMFTAMVRAPFPFSKVYWQSQPCNEEEKEVYIRPCDTTVASELYVTFGRTDKNPVESEIKTKIIKENLPAALWGRKEEKESLTEEKAGLEIRIREQTEGYMISGEIGVGSDQSSFVEAQAKQLPWEDYRDRDVWEELEKIQTEPIRQTRSRFLRGLEAGRYRIRFYNFTGDGVFSGKPVMRRIGGGELNES